MRRDLTRAWQGERFPDGRPKVPDSVLERLTETTAEEAWGVLMRNKYTLQFAGGFKQIETVPGKRLVGRVVTAVFMPTRPDVHGVIAEHGKKEGRVQTGGQNSWVIDILQPGDVLVVDMFGKIKDGTFIGDNLGTSIFTKSGTGLVVDGSVRDLSGLREIKVFTAYVRDFHPSAIRDVTLMGINVPIRIGEVTVMPGDIVLGDPEGVTFIPPHLAEQVADDSERTRMRDRWGHQMLREGKYTPGEVDSRWSKEMEAEFDKWMQEQKKKR
jgi:4-hydroxy-4-methyl-2-oxoglutarate aldolase